MHALEGSKIYADVLTPYAEVARRPHAARPWVLANMVCGLDGSTAVAGRVGALSTPADAVLFKRLRSLADVVLVGAATVRQERYGPVRLDPALQAGRATDGRAPIPPIAVVSRSMGFDWATPLFATEHGPRPIIVTCEAAPPGAIESAAQHADVIVAGSDNVDIEVALVALADRGYSVVLCEGGATLLGELAARDVLDELCLTMAPLMGGDALPVARASDAPILTRFRLAHVACEDDALFLRYERDRPHS